MVDARRNFAQSLLSFTLAAVLFGIAPLDLARAQVKLPPPHPGPNPPEDEPKVDIHEVLKHNQKQIEDDIRRLYALATDLKKQVDATNSADVLSVTLLQKADEVEKLAHQIKTLAKG
ncbi:MAG: hypothetical protein WB869_11650 [Candidatus Acidiferrales bacterium]|jgi:hypothetical protein